MSTATTPANLAAAIESELENGPAPVDERHLRYSSLIDLKALYDLHVDIIGCGAIGARVATVLASIGIRSLSLYDDDVVSAVNVGTQGFPPRYIGSSKVSVLNSSCGGYGTPDAPISIKTYTERVTPAHFYELVPPEPLPPNWNSPSLNVSGRTYDKRVIVCTVDSLATRRELFHAALQNSTAERPLFGLWLDSRMSAEEFEVYTVVPERTSCATYLRSLDEDEGPPLSAESCTARATLYCASMAGALLVSSLMRWLRKDIIPRPFKLHIPTMTLDRMAYLSAPSGGRS